MPSHVLIVFLFANFVGAIHAQNRITIEIGGSNSTTDLQSYLSDLHVAVSSVQYTANMSMKMLIELMDKLKRNEVKCQCSSDVKPKSVARSKLVGRLDYRRTSQVAAHKLYTRPLKWNDARKSCKLEGAELATVESIDEAQLLAKTLDEAKPRSLEVNTTESAFMGVHSHFEPNDWVTVRGESLPPSSPVVSNGSFHRCAVLTVHSNLNAVDCNQPRPYLCELRFEP